MTIEPKKLLAAAAAGLAKATPGAELELQNIVRTIEAAQKESDLIQAQKG